MGIYKLERKTILPVSLEEAWGFFSSPHNLVKITPSFMNFRIVSDLNDLHMYEGMQIEYRVCPFAGLPLKWITRIKDVKEHYQFKDIQLKGPFRLWEHTHTFNVLQNNEVEMIDEVRYALPFGILGSLAHALVVKKQLEHIFEYRKNVIDTIFAKK